MGRADPALIRLRKFTQQLADRRRQPEDERILDGEPPHAFVDARIRNASHAQSLRVQRQLEVREAVTDLR